MRWLAPALVALVGLGACGGELAVIPSECDSLRGVECTPRKQCYSVETSNGVEFCGPGCADRNTCLDGRKPVVGTHYRHPDEPEDYISLPDDCVCVP
jgi:hypothetical protein